MKKIRTFYGNANELAVKVNVERLPVMIAEHLPFY